MATSQSSCTQARALLGNTLYGNFAGLTLFVDSSWFDALSIFHFYPLPFSFTWKLYLVAVSFMAVLAILPDSQDD